MIAAALLVATFLILMVGVVHFIAADSYRITDDDISRLLDEEDQ